MKNNSTTMLVNSHNRFVFMHSFGYAMVSIVTRQLHGHGVYMYVYMGMVDVTPNLNLLINSMYS